MALIVIGIAVYIFAVQQNKWLKKLTKVVAVVFAVTEVISLAITNLSASPWTVAQ